MVTWFLESGGGYCREVPFSSLRLLPPIQRTVPSSGSDLDNDDTWLSLIFSRVSSLVSVFQLEKRMDFYIQLEKLSKNGRNFEPLQKEFLDPR